MGGGKKGTVLKLIFLFLFLLLAYYLGGHTNLTSYIDRDFIHSFGAWAPIMYLLVYIIATILVVPGTLLTLVGALLFGTWLGTLYTVIGATIGAVAAFHVARFGGRGIVEKLLKGKLIAFDEEIEKNGFKIVFFFRLVPIFPFSVINYALGITKVRMKDYTAATFLGMIPGTFVYTYLFAKLGEKVMTEGFRFKDFLAADIILPITLFIALIVIPLFLRKKTKKVADRYIRKEL